MVAFCRIYGVVVRYCVAHAASRPVRPDYTYFICFGLICVEALVLDRNLDSAFFRFTRRQLHLGISSQFEAGTMCKRSFSPTLTPLPRIHDVPDSSAGTSLHFVNFFDTSDPGRVSTTLQRLSTA